MLLNTERPRRIERNPDSSDLYGVTTAAIDLPPERLSRADLLRRGGIALGLVVLLMQLAVWLPMHIHRPDTNLDWIAYYDASRNVLSGHSLYADCVTYHVGDPPSFYIYPPPLAVALAPLAAHGAAFFQAAWYVVILASFWLYAGALVRLAGFRMNAANILIGGAAIALAPGVTVSMSFGNADMLIWALCALSLGGGPVWSGLGAAFKLYPAWELLTRLLRRDWWALVGVGAALVVVVNALHVVGLHAFREWGAALAILGGGPRLNTNVSISTAMVRLAGSFGYGGSGRLFLAASPLVGVPVVAFALRHRTRQLQGAVVLVAAVILGPLCWWYWLAPMSLMIVAALLRNKAVDAS